MTTHADGNLNPILDLISDDKYDAFVTLYESHVSYYDMKKQLTMTGEELGACINNYEDVYGANDPANYEDPAYDRALMELVGACPKDIKQL